ncbi:hypothetical protein JCM14076_28930 [Methylosoma difficile]
MNKPALRLRPFCAALFCTYCSLSLAEPHATVTLTTDNVSRWFSKTNHNVALQANVDYQHASGLFLGSSVSNIDYEHKKNDQSAHVEIIPYLGWNVNLNEQWRANAQISRYLYDGEVFGHNADYNEYYLFLHYKDVFSGRISYIDDFYQLGNYALDMELTGKYPLSDHFELSTSFGYSHTKTVLGSDYPYWNAGITYFYNIFAIDLRYMDASETNIEQNLAEKMHEKYDPPLLNSNIVLSVSVGF